MYVLVEHRIHVPETFWANVAASLPRLPAYLTLHHCFPARDGSHAVCLWEAESGGDLRGWLEAYVGHLAENAYFEVENREGIAAPAAFSPPAPTEE